MVGCSILSQRQIVERACFSSGSTVGAQLDDSVGHGDNRHQKGVAFAVIQGQQPKAVLFSSFVAGEQ
jgi:hypothetical protein